MCKAAARDRVHVFDVENHEGTPVYVHAKVCVVDDVWASVGSDNFNRRSWTHDSELSCAVLDETRDEREPTDPAGLGDGARVFARDLRLRADARAPRPRPATTTSSTRRRRARTRSRRAEALDDWHEAASAARGRRAGCAARAEKLGRLTRLWAVRRTGCSTTRTAGPTAPA